MDKKNTGKIRVPKLLVFSLGLLLSCSHCVNKKTFNNINVYSKKQVSGLINRKIPGHIKTIPPRGIFSRCGTVSHHLLVSSVISLWFRELKIMRKVKTFIIISPSHYQSGRGNISLSFHDWNTAGSITKVNGRIVRSIMHSLNIREDNCAFYNEHGIEVLLPFISYYFPEAEIVPILMDEENKSGEKIILLSHAISRIMQKNKEIFLLISADFSHRSGRKETDINDAMSMRSLLFLSEYPVRPCSDNTAGLMVLYRVCKFLGINSSHIFCHTDSAKFTLADQANNITSYFFTFQY